MSRRQLEKIPYFAIVGGVLILSMLLYCTDQPNFASQILPTYTTQALVYIAFGYVFLRGHQNQGFIAFLMALDWLMMQILIWSNLGAALTASLWILFVFQLLLVYYFFTGKILQFAGQGGQVWAYAGLWLTFAFGIGKLWVLWAAAQTLVALPFWGLGVALISLGYILQPVEEEWSVPLKLIGLLLAVIAAFTVQAPGLRLMP